MFLIVGLGNPGDKYINTRHNVGFDVLDILAYKYNIKIEKEKFKGLFNEIRIKGEKVILLKPLTYMNLSGESVVQFVNYYNIPLKNVIIIHDDISIDIGKIRIRQKGSSGGQNGVKNIIQNLSSDNFNRIKVGIGSPENDLVSYVLGKFSDEERKIIDKTIELAASAAENIITNGVVEAMNKFNGLRVE
ncbi:peptidyl-tRNA hydrolase [Clostridium tepidiprofundi DSM 19306]|uniref:Peptidyl-tRNA hydrolase n=1 Tax=Clostridium tepidiprofundi DSM 19306 TaxID=1121338 RepID=A0A151B3N2_9CLOT|nr:aminoacyl-tRNA hydrolase [Clostridium tepidiprofundi]KYH34362.1 peptidyl-tRNA hydrolase [Clostridium tepidiprofundi DSM 19306]